MIKNIVRRLIPRSAMVHVKRFKIARLRREYGALSIQDAFSKIYEDNRWGGARGEFVSGSGSIGKPADIYVKFVCQFIRDNNVNSVVDLGCGDFRIGKEIARETSRYIGIDVVRELVKYNEARYSSEKIAFKCLDITADDLPPGDLCLLRQVLQHLSNTEISLVLNKLYHYRYVIITEHFPALDDKFIANKDKAHGPDTRLVDKSAVVLTVPPFGIQNIREVLAVYNDECQSSDSIRSFLWTPSG
ncbi:MAG: class I SAM-dependent methyltransferase [Methylococcus sp.]|nr:class I SAM-dependent methyltransferase [Methylococcus sp.]